MKTLLNYLTFALLLVSCYCVKKYTHITHGPELKPRALHLIGSFTSDQQTSSAPIQMKLHITDHFVQGTYRPINAKADVSVIGALNSENEVILVETSAGKTTGTFKGTLESRDDKLLRLTGIWTGVNSTYLRAFLMDEVRR